MLAEAKDLRAQKMTKAGCTTLLCSNFVSQSMLLTHSLPLSKNAANHQATSPDDQRSLVGRASLVGPGFVWDWIQGSTGAVSHPNWLCASASLSNHDNNGIKAFVWRGREATTPSKALSAYNGISSHSIAKVALGTSASVTESITTETRVIGIFSSLVQQASHIITTLVI